MTCAFVMVRPITNARLVVSQRTMGCNQAPLWHFLTPGRRNSAIGMHGNQRQSGNQHQAFKMRLRRGHAQQASKKQESRCGVVRKRWHRKCAISRQSRTRRCAIMNELLRGQECLRRRRAASVPQRMRPDAVCASYRAKGDSTTHKRCSNPHGRTPLHPTANEGSATSVRR